MYQNLETPFFLIDKQELSKNLNEMKKALNQNFKKWIIGYSYKTNSLPWIINFMKENDCFAEVVSFDEYNLAKYIGANKVIYNGPMKNKDTFLEAIRNGSIVNIETHREIEWLKSLEETNIYKVGIRVNFDIEEYCPDESACGTEGGRFGFCYENGELSKVFKELNELSNIKLAGLHFHTSSKTRSVNIYKTISKIAVKIIDDYSLKLDYIDIGGGFFGGLSTKPSFNEYFLNVKNILSDISYFDDLTIIVEPGAALIASPISFYTSVIDVKVTNRNIFITTDGSRNDIDPLMSKTRYLFDIIYNSKKNASKVYKQIISGFTCMEHDRLFELVDYPLLNVGDIIKYNKVGSYTICLSPLFIKYYPSIYLKDGENIELIRRKWTPIDYVHGGGK